MRERTTYRLASLAMLSAIAYAVMLVMSPFGRIMPAAPFLKYEAKDVIIAMGGFIFGPVPALAVSAVVALVEMITISESGPIGCVMNFLASATFACTAALIYKKKRTAAGALAGLVCASLVMTAVMMLWNYIVTPIYQNVPREVVAGMMLPVFMPFNLIKSGLNTALALMLYKPLVRALRAARLLPRPDAGAKPAEGEAAPQQGFRIHPGVWMTAVLLLATCLTYIFVINR